MNLEQIEARARELPRYYPDSHVEPEISLSLSEIIALIACVREVEAENAELREQTRWRDVREELPPLGVEVWAWIDWLKRAVKMKRVDNGEHDGEWEWVDCDGFDDPEWSEDPPTHWQPLPNVPKEQT